jgi:hypothetical protein
MRKTSECQERRRRVEMAVAAAAAAQEVTNAAPIMAAMAV